MKKVLLKKFCYYAIALLLSLSFTVSQPIPTNEWINLFSASSAFDSLPLPVGAIVDVFDPDGVWCGTFTVTTEGQYGFLLVYKDDSMTSDVDEGAEPGDSITFKINNHIAFPIGSDSPIWTTNGAVIQINLEGFSNYAPVISSFPDSTIFRSDTSVFINLDDYVEDIDHPDSSLHWSVSGYDSLQVNIDPNTNVAELSAPLAYYGTENLVFTVTDDSAATDNDTLIVEVIPYIYSVTNSLSAGWNLISWEIDTENDSLELVLSEILEDVDVVLGFENGGLTYDPDWPQFSTLLSLDHLHGYWIRTLANIQLSVTGATVDDGTAILMEEGWNLISYLPSAADSLSHALGSILDDVIVVLGFDGGGLTYDPNWPQFSNLQILSPGYGYWVKLTSPDTLIYPDHQVLSNQFQSIASFRSSRIDSVIPTNEWVNFMSQTSTLNDQPIPVGAVVDAYDPDGVLCGTFTVTAEGQYGFLLVYRDDTTTPETDEGSEPGDTITFYINDHLVFPTGPGEPIWTANGDVIQLNLEGYSNYAPVISNFPDSITFRADSIVFLDLNQYVEDIDHPDSTLIWSVTGNDSVQVNINSPANIAQLSAPISFSGIESLVFTVTDDSLASDSVTLIVVVLQVLAIFENEYVPVQFYLGQNYPNPFNQTTQVEYALPIVTDVTIRIYDFLGREVFQYHKSDNKPGLYLFQWNGINNQGIEVASGVYLYHLKANEFTSAKKMLLIK